MAKDHPPRQRPRRSHPGTFPDVHPLTGRVKHPAATAVEVLAGASLVVGAPQRGLGRQATRPTRRSGPEYAPRVFGESEASASRRPAGRHRARESIFTTAAVGVTCRRTRTSKRLRLGCRLTVGRHPGEKGVDEPGARCGASFSDIRPAASAVISEPHLLGCRPRRSRPRTRRTRPVGCLGGGSRAVGRRTIVWATIGT